MREHPLGVGGPIVGFALLAACLLLALGISMLQPAGAAAQWQPVAAYSFDKGEGSVAEDSAGNHDGSLFFTEWVKGKYGSALRYDGFNDYVEIPDSPELQLTGSFTLEAWVRPEKLETHAVAISKEAGSFYSYKLYVNSREETGVPEGFLGYEPWGWSDVGDGADTLTPKTWNHLALTYDGTNLRLYVNGELVDTEEADPGMASVGPLMFGGNDDEEFLIGRIDEVRIYDRALSAEEVESDRLTPVETPSSDPVASYSFDKGEGSVVEDLSGSHDGSAKNTDWTRGKFGSALYFDGVGDYVEIADSSELQLTEEFTLETWVRPDAVEDEGAVISKTAGSNFSYQLFAGSREFAGIPEGYLAYEPWAWDDVEDDGPLTPKTWNHLALTYDGALQRLYVNGELVDTSYEPTGPAQASVGPLYLGGNEGEEDFKGRIDEVRIYDRALSAEEVESDRLAPIQTPSRTPVAAYSFDKGEGSIAEDFFGENDGEIEGATWFQNGRFGKALLFNGPETCVTVPHSSELELGEELTLEAWVKPDTLADQPIIYKSAWGLIGYAMGISLYEYGKFEGLIGEGEGKFENAVSPDPIEKDVWSHLAFTYDGAKMRLYVNGELVATETQSTPPPGGEGPLALGCNPLYPEDFDGLIDEIRIYDRALSAEEVEIDRRSPIETPPRSPVAAYSFDEGQGETARDTTGNHDGTLEGATWTDGVANAAPALGFDGVDDCLTVPHHSDLELTGDFTIGTWALREGSGADEPLIVKETEGFFGYGLYLGFQESGKVEGLVGEGSEATEVTSPTTLPTGVWTHVALSFDGDNLRLYVNGSLVDTTPAEGAQSSKGPLRLGCNEELEDHYKGRLDETRIYDRALEGDEVAALRDLHAPMVSIGGPLVESEEGPLGVTTAAVTVAAVDQGEPLSGIQKIWMEVDGKAGPAYHPSCPCRQDASASLVYDREKWGPGPHDVTIHVVDAAYNETIQRLAIDVPDGPALSLSGSLYERRGKRVGKLTHTLQIEASQTNGSSAAPRPGVKEIAVKVDGVNDPSPKTQTCSAGNCGMSRTWEFNPTKYSNGLHEIEVRTKDQRGNLTTRTFKVTVKSTDSCADYAVNPTEGCAPEPENILHLHQYNGNPNRSGVLLGEEWIKLGSLEARQISSGGAITTRGNAPCAGEPEKQCAETRTVTAGATPGKTRYFVTKGSSTTDPNLDVVGEVNKVTLSSMGTPQKTGPLADGLAPWQDPPPGHGSTYSYFESTQIDEEGGYTTTTKWWFDSGTGLLLRRTVTGSRVQDQQPRVMRFFFSYDQKAYSDEEVPPTLFLVPQPEEIETEWVRQASAELEAPELLEAP